MLQNFRTMASVLTLATVISAPAFAEGLYYGLNLSVSDSSSGFPGGGAMKASDSYASLGGTLGYAWSKETHFLAAEVNYDRPLGADLTNDSNGELCMDAPNGPYFCTHDATLRLRGLVGTELGKADVFFSFGVAAMSGIGATSPGGREDGQNVGVTFGIGAQQETRLGKIRYEAIVDRFDNVRQSPAGRERDFSSVSMRVSWLLN